VRGLLDTSVFIAREHARVLDTARLPDEAAISVVSLAELELGVLLAASADVRARRLRTLGAVRATYEALAADAPVASAFAALVAAVRQTGGRNLRVQDAWIAATATAHGVPVVTHDADFDGLPGVTVIRV
jgi:predicted nucleic acid-binding protein